MTDPRLSAVERDFLLGPRIPGGGLLGFSPLSLATSSQFDAPSTTSDGFGASGLGGNPGVGNPGVGGAGAGGASAGAAGLGAASGNGLLGGAAGVAGAVERLRLARRLFESIELPVVESLTPLLRSTAIARLVSVEPRSFSQWVLNVSSPTYFVVLRPTNWEGRLALEIDLELLSALIERLLGGEGRPSPTARRPLTDLELPLARRLTTAILSGWQQAWSGHGVGRIEVEQTVSTPQRVRAWGNSSVLLQAEFELALGDVAGPVRIISLADPVWSRAAAAGARGGDFRRPARGSAMSNSNELVVSLCELQLTPDEVADLQPGDLLITDHAVHQPLEAQLPDSPPMLVRLGALDGRKAVEPLAPLGDPSA